MTSPYITEVTEENYEAEVLKSDKPVLIDFYATWCGPCKAIAPALEALAENKKDILKVVKVNVDNAPKLARDFFVRSVPFFAVMKDGKTVDSRPGSGSPKVLESFVTAALKKIPPAPTPPAGPKI